MENYKTEAKEIYEMCEAAENMQIELLKSGIQNNSYVKILEQLVQEAVKRKLSLYSFEEKMLIFSNLIELNKNK